jgi:glycosyltransferase involved in cell wall biosynthesis
MQTTTIWVNSRFLSRKITGVERVAHEILRSLAANFLDEHGHYKHEQCHLVFKLVMEKNAPETTPDYALGWEVVRLGGFKGHVWEQLNLAFFKPRDWVLSLCNTGPMLRRKHAVFFHDAQVYAIPTNFDWKFRWWYHLLINTAGRMNRVLFTNSAFSKTELSLHTKIAQDKFAINHLGCDHMLRLKPEKPTDMMAKLANQPYVLAVSSASPNKNFDSVLKALALMGPNAPHCVIVGQQYSKVFKGGKLNNERVIEMGYVSDDMLAGLYKHAMCLIYPSFYEGFGLPPLEAMLLGCPVIASNRSSLPEVCGDAALYCDPSDPQTIASAISKLIEQPELVQQLRIKSKEHAANFTWKKSAERTLAGLCHALEHKNLH